jgi:dolichol kinase
MHLLRKLFHATGVVIVLAYHGLDLSRPLVAGVLGGITLLLALLDLWRARSPEVQERFQALFRVLLDPKDTRGLNGSTLYFAGCTLTAALFAQPVACAGILALALGDPAAAIVGSSVRSPRRGRVSLAGSAACFVAASAGCAFFVPLPSALVGGLAATALEAFAGSKLDNLAIPVGTAAVLGLLVS